MTRTAGKALRLDGKRALVTAAGQGIGRAVAVAFAQQGATVLAADINEESLATLRDEGHAGLTCITLDVTDSDAVHELGHAHAGPDAAFNVVFNCVGAVHAGTLLDCSEEQLQASWDLNVRSMFRICKALLPGMVAAGGGSIINMSSVASSVKAVANRFAYSTTKAAVIGLTKSIAIDFVGAGIRCNAICPGTVATPSLAGRVADQARAQGRSVEAVGAEFAARQPMGRIGRPEEIAALALHLASDESAFTTGAIHVIDGGWSN